MRLPYPDVEHAEQAHDEHRGERRRDPRRIGMRVEESVRTRFQPLHPLDAAIAVALLENTPLGEHRHLHLPQLELDMRGERGCREGHARRARLLEREPRGGTQKEIIYLNENTYQINIYGDIYN